MRLNDPSTADDSARPAGTDAPPPLARPSRTNLPTAVPDLPPVPELRLAVVEARHSWNVEDVKEVWRFRELLDFLTLRDIKIRYKQTILGVGRSLLQPLATVLVPPLMALVGLTALGFGAMLSGPIAVQRDFRYLLTFGMQLWMFCTPCIYRPLSGIGPRMRELLPLNPLYGIILNFRSCLLGEAIQWPALAISWAVSMVILAVGLVYFRRVENTMADTI